MRTADFLLKRRGLCYEDLSAIEFNEAFAVIDVLFDRAHHSCLDRYNRLGGALAYGHPYGATGAILAIPRRAADWPFSPLLEQAAWAKPFSCICDAGRYGIGQRGRS